MPTWACATPGSTPRPSARQRGTAPLTGHNHHSVATGVVVDQATGYPGYNSVIYYGFIGDDTNQWQPSLMVRTVSKRFNLAGTFPVGRLVFDELSLYRPRFQKLQDLAAGRTLPRRRFHAPSSPGRSTGGNQDSRDAGVFSPRPGRWITRLVARPSGPVSNEICALTVLWKKSFSPSANNSSLGMEMSG